MQLDRGVSDLLHFMRVDIVPESPLLTAHVHRSSDVWAEEVSVDLDSADDFHVGGMTPENLFLSFQVLLGTSCEDVVG